MVLIIKRLHCVHRDYDRMAHLLVGVEYCCLCGAERIMQERDVSGHHGPHLRGRVREPVPLWEDNCPNAPEEPSYTVMDAGMERLP